MQQAVLPDDDALGGGRYDDAATQLSAEAEPLAKEAGRIAAAQAPALDASGDRSGGIDARVAV